MNNSKKLLDGKWRRSFLIIVVLVLLIELAGPYGLYQLSKPTTQKSEANNGIFLESYEASRQRFLGYSPVLQATWHQVTQQSYPIPAEKGLYIDVIQADANKNKKNLIIFTSGIHGIEGYVGAAMMDVFKSEYISKLNPDNTGVIFVHAVNPWGMKHWRRVNEHNVDLNRNFLYNWQQLNENQNTNYNQLAAFFGKKRQIENAMNHEIGFYSNLAYHLIKDGSGTIKKALLTGQYNHPKGVYYGGSQDESSTIIIKRLYRSILKSDYQNIVHIDLHTGYGPKYQMSIFSSMNETMTSDQAEKAFQYPLVLTPTSKDFYATEGDNTKYFFELQKQEYPNKNLYTTTFEFGTMGDSTLASILSLKNTIDENELYWSGSSNKTAATIIENRYKEMFYPSEQKWRDKAVQDFNQAITGILKYKKVIQ